jgi:DNA repair protein RAD50
MSKIDKLQILGIRSFGNQHGETIQFLSPLTLVVGYNGSGKTTIIECLKYATTGMQPPNTNKGGAFVHDPKLCGENEVMAQVKLSFKSSSGAKMVVTRSLQLTVKKATRSLKTLEGQLVMLKDGERTSISSRVAELDQIMPQYLGVSQAVLDNVIFCHQDESLWPMSEPSVLKKKFDEIFEALKYTKAIDNIKQLRKKQNEELAKFKIMEQHAKEDKDRAKKAQKQSEKLHKEIETMREECEELGRKMKHAAELADKAWKEAESYSRIMGALEGKRIEARSKQAIITDLADHLKEVPESDEWLSTTLEQFHSRLSEYEEERQAKGEEYQERKQQVEGLRHQLGQKLAEKGKHEQDKEEYERQLERRKTMIRDVASRHSIRGYDDLTDDNRVEDFIYKIRKVSKEQHAALERARREADSEKREAQSLVNQLTQRRAALQESKVAAKKQMALNDHEERSFQNKVNEIAVDEGHKAVIESRIEDLGGRIQKARNSAAGSAWDKGLADANAELRSYEEESSRLNNELIQGTKKAGEMAKVAHLKQELKDSQRSLKTMIGAHGDKIKMLLGDDWQPATLEQKYQAAVAERTRELQSAERDRDAVARELEQLQYQQKTNRDELNQKAADLKESEQAVRDAIEDEPSEYPTAIREMQDRLDRDKDQIAEFAGLGDYMQKILETANGPKPCCRVCERPFKQEAELARFRKKLENLVKKVKIDADASDMEERELEMQKARDAGFHYETWKRLSNTEIPSLKREQEQLSSQREILLTKIEDHDKLVEKRQQVKKELDMLSRTVTTITKCEADIRNYERQIEDLSAKQSQSGTIRTLDEVQDQLASLGDKIRSTKLVISRLTTEKDQSRLELSAMELELRDVKNELNTASFQLEKKAELVVRAEEYRALNQKERELVDKADKDIDKLEPEISTAKEKYDDIAQLTETKERELQREASELSESVNALNLLNDQIKSYVDRGGPSQLPRTKREIKTIEEDISRIETEQAAITRYINKISDQLRDSENTRRQYADNLRYRQESRALEQLETEIKGLTAHNAEVDRERFTDESTRRTNDHHRLKAIQAGKMGEMKSKDVQLVQLLADYETDFKDAPRRYKETHIKVETTKAVVEDLGRYGGALDKAIMKYHSLKMAEINRIIEELWQRTYQGTDVDTILIRSDGENSKGGRSYNYRVCMVKQDVEMDMRGRCSAGQKVLASIIIRLALAECFGVNCGLIALDEPTTNLDTDNIRALAQSLHDIIKARQQQSNFQLIVITHDETFLKYMQCGEFCDYYWRVSRNERQKSIIEKNAISEVL